MRYTIDFSKFKSDRVFIVEDVIYPPTSLKNDDSQPEANSPITSPFFNLWGEDGKPLQSENSKPLLVENYE